MINIKIEYAEKLFNFHPIDFYKDELITFIRNKRQKFNNKKNSSY